MLTLDADLNLETRVLLQLESLFSQCAQAGAARDDVRDVLQNLLAAESEKAASQQREIMRQEALDSPVGVALQELSALYASNPRLRFDLQCAEGQHYLAKSEEFFELCWGAKVGDAIKVHAWSVPRTFRLRRLSVEFRAPGDPFTARVVATGEGLLNCPKREASAEHYFGLTALVEVMEADRQGRWSAKPIA